MQPLDSHLAQIDLRLQNWARWYIKIIEAGLLCASIPWDKIVQARRHNTPKHLPIPTNTEAEEIDAVIVQLWRFMPDLARALHSYYLMPGNGKQQAQAIGLSFSCFKERVRLAKIWLVAYLLAKKEVKHMQ